MMPRPTETVTNCYCVNRQIHLTLLSTDIKILYTSFESMTDRLTPSATDRLLIMYGILLRHFFFVPAVVYSGHAIFNVAGVNVSLLGKYRLFHQTNILKQFLMVKSYTAFRCVYCLSMAIFERRYFTR